MSEIYNSCETKSFYLRKKCKDMENRWNLRYKMKNCLKTSPEF